MLPFKVPAFLPMLSMVALLDGTVEQTTYSGAVLAGSVRLIKDSVLNNDSTNRAGFLSDDCPPKSMLSSNLKVVKALIGAYVPADCESGNTYFSKAYGIQKVRRSK